MENPQTVLWAMLDEFVQKHGLSLYDLEVPAGSTGVLRVFICRSKGTVPNVEERAASSGITVDDCAIVNRFLRDLHEEDKLSFFGGKEQGWSIEVSSPGINRKLSSRALWRGGWRASADESALGGGGSASGRS